MKFLIFLNLVLCATFVNSQYNRKPSNQNHGSQTLHNNTNKNIVFEWRLLNYDFPSTNDRQNAIDNGNLIPSNGVPIDVQPHYSINGPRIFITIPRFDTGIPYSLATATSNNISPYPSYEWHSSHGTNCNYITSAFRVAINECNQMWVLDSGLIGPSQLCPPQLLLFDLNSDTLIERYRFNTSHYTPAASLFVTPIIHTRDPPPRGRCQNTMVYIADVDFHGLVIYDQRRKSAWRAENKFMYPSPAYGTHTIAGESFTLMDGILAMATDKINLYFHPLASISEFAVPLRVLDNNTIWEDDVEAMSNQFKHLGSRPSQCAQEAIDSRNNIYCVTFNPIKLLSWNTNTPYLNTNLREISFDERLLEFVSGMKVVSNQGNEELWMLSNRFQKISSGTQNPDEINFRILKLSVTSASNNDLHTKLIFSP